MLLKTEFTGASMKKYTIVMFIIKIIIFIAFIAACIPNGVVIVDHIQAVVNTGVDLDLYFVLKQVGYMFLNFILAIVLEIVVAFGVIFPLVKRELNNSRW